MTPIFFGRLRWGLTMRVMAGAIFIATFASGAFLTSCGRRSMNGITADSPLILGAEPFPSQPDGGPGEASAMLWISIEKTDGALRAPKLEELTLTCSQPCAVMRSRTIEGSPQGVLAILVDDSGSNFAEPSVCAGCPTDPNGKRVEGIKNLIHSLLGAAPKWRVALFDFPLIRQTSIFSQTNHLAGYTSRPQDLLIAAEGLATGGGTVLYDSIYDVLSTLPGERRMTFGADSKVPMRLLAISDGEDTHSTRKLSSVLDAGAQMGASIDCLGYGAVDGGVYPNLAGKAYRDLRQIGITSGGFVSLVDRDELPDRMEKLGAAYVGGWLEVVISRPIGQTLTGAVKYQRQSASFSLE